MPSLVSDKLAFIMKELAAVCDKMRGERVKILKDNEEHIEEEEKKRAKVDNDDDDEDEDGFQDDNEDEEIDDDDNENAILSKLAKMKKEGKTLEKDVDEEDDDDDDDDDSDSDYEYTGGDLAIYDSALDDVDELLFVKEALEKLNAADSNYTG